MPLARAMVGYMRATGLVVVRIVAWAWALVAGVGGLMSKFPAVR
jgi:hypothetical protein